MAGFHERLPVRGSDVGGAIGPVARADRADRARSVPDRGAGVAGPDTRARPNCRSRSDQTSDPGPGRGSHACADCAPGAGHHADAHGPAGADVPAGACAHAYAYAYAYAYARARRGPHRHR